MGEVFAGRYELADPIGRGGVGAVWRAWDHRRRRYVAAKVLQQSDAHTLLRFVREQSLRIDHPHVLAPASWAADDDKVLFTMDLVAGGSLVHLVADYGPLPPQFVCLLLDQLLSGLSAVHAEGVVHRDIKPANLLLEATGTGLPHLRVSDFGIAMRKGEPRLTEADYVVGTPGYFAPEQEMGAEPDFPADLFATGLVGLYLLEGARPDSRALVKHFEEHGTPRAPRGVPGPLWDVLAGLLQPDPDTRFRTATGARKALLSASELLPEPGPDDELIEVFDQLGPLPPGFAPGGPAVRGRRARPLDAASTPTGGATPPLHEASTVGPGMGAAGPGGSAAGPEAGPETGAAGPGATPSAHGAVAPPSTNSPLPPRPSAPPTASVPSAAAIPPAPPTPPAAHIPPAPELPPAPPVQHTPPPAKPPAPPVQHTPPPAKPTAPPAEATPPPAELTAPPTESTPPPARPTQPPATPTPTPLPVEFTPPHVTPPPPTLRPGPPAEPTPAPAPAPSHDPSPSPGHDSGPGPKPAAGTTPSHDPAAPVPEPALAPTPLTPHPAAPSPLAPPQARHSLYAHDDAEVPRLRPPRPGPPARVTIPVLLLAVICFAVGIWALTHP
ncbi:MULTISPECIES: serine/threonine-protein kinase [unclassified Streptomyces]|uniref:serine/threonine-protein kinase n=1 Tax=unclassified Streptomyces TaxID=2593676 RepID=UPI00278BFD95|nr:MULTISPECIES: serine/threonine-protein kinase [unclassified Streptomyces]